MLTLRTAACICIFSTALLVQTAQASPAFLPLGFYAHGLSADGTVVVGGFTEFAGGGAFRWTAETGRVPIGPPFIAIAWDASADGSVIVGRDSANLAFRWTESGTWAYLDDLEGGLAVSDDGSAVVGIQYERAARWTSAGVELLGELEKIAYGISGDGSTVVGGGFGGPALIWRSDGTTIELPQPPSGLSAALDASHDGSVVVGHLGGNAFRWTEAAGMVLLERLPGSTHGTRASYVSADGNVIVGHTAGVPGESGDEIFYWTPARGPLALEDLLERRGADLAGWDLEQPMGFSADGRVILGYARNPSGQLESFLAFIPEPATSLLLAMGLGCLGVRSTRDRPGREDRGVVASRQA